VAIGRRLHHGQRAEDGAPAWPVVHHHRLAPQLGQLLGNGPDDGVGGASGLLRRDQLDRPGRCRARLLGQVGRLRRGGCGRGRPEGSDG
jgi:hypothetical protein